MVVVSEAGLACQHFRDNVQEAIWLEKQNLQNYYQNDQAC